MPGDRKKFTGVLLGAAVLGLGILLISLVLINTRPKQQTGPTTGPAPATETEVFPQPNFPDPPPEEPIVYAYSGSVTEIHENEITLETERGLKKITLTPATRYSIQHTPTNEDRRTLSPAEIQAKFFLETSNKSEIKIKDIITAENPQNIRGMQEFSAAHIIIIR